VDHVVHEVGWSRDGSQITLMLALLLMTGGPIPLLTLSLVRAVKVRRCRK